MNNIEEIVIEGISDITGLDIDSINKIRDLNLFENELLDSLSFVNLINEVEEKLDIKIDFTQYKIEDLSYIDSLIRIIGNISNS